MIIPTTYTFTLLCNGKPILISEKQQLMDSLYVLLNYIKSCKSTDIEKLLNNDDMNHIKKLS